jgi:hypothetical protein
LRIIKLPTMTSAPPVAQAGMLAKIGAKNTDTRKARPVVTAVIPVFPPSEIPVADSMNAVTGDVPISAPIEIEKASTQYAHVEFSKSRVTGSRRPANFAMEYSVPVVSRARNIYQGVGIREIKRAHTQDINIQEGDERVPHLALTVVEVDRVTDVVKRLERDNFLEEVEVAISRCVVGERGNGRGSRPRDDRNEEDADKDCTFDAVKHQKDSEDSADEYAEPHRVRL